jgi:hypothetical protein
MKFKVGDIIRLKDNPFYTRMVTKVTDDTYVSIPFRGGGISRSIE